MATYSYLFSLSLLRSTSLWTAMEHGRTYKIIGSEYNSSNFCKKFLQFCCYFQALEYARNVPKPKVVVRMRNEETNTDPLLQQQQNIPAVVQIHDTRATSSGRVTEEDPELIGLQELKARHDREVAKVAQIRQKVESAT